MVRINCLVAAFISVTVLLYDNMLTSISISERKYSYSDRSLNQIVQDGYTFYNAIRLGIIFPENFEFCALAATLNTCAPKMHVSQETVRWEIKLPCLLT
jgi:hypothetical protein